jgi:xanthine dehydrogenase accessory factor
VSTELLREASIRIGAGEQVALATLVATRGSTPQKVAARLLVRRDGGVLGTLGGGAVEAEAIREARARLEAGVPVLREYALATATDEWGLACGGTMVVFVEPLGPPALAWLEPIAEAADGEPVAVVTVLDGSRCGTRLVVRERAVTGSLDDPALDAEAAELGRRVLGRESAGVATIGGVRVYAEAFGPPAELTVVGAGHVGKALAALAKFLRLRVTVLDDRPEYASRERFPEAAAVIAAPIAEAIARSRVTARTAVVVAMRNHDLDYEAVAAALRTPARYVGLIGSRRKAILIAERLVADGVPSERVREIRSPIGLDIGARSPEEIALSILGEWLMLRQGGSGAPLQLADDLFRKATARAGAGAGGGAEGGPGPDDP